jgi:hypothetical protein
MISFQFLVRLYLAIPNTQRYGYTHLRTMPISRTPILQPMMEVQQPSTTAIGISFSSQWIIHGLLDFVVYFTL